MIYFLKHIYMKNKKSKEKYIARIEHFFKSTNKELIGITLAIGIILLGMILYSIYNNWFSNTDNSMDSNQYYQDDYNQYY